MFFVSKKIKISIIISLLLLGLIILYLTLSPNNKQQKEDKDEEVVIKPNDGINQYGRRTLWIDLQANIGNLNTPEKVENIIAKAEKANFDTIVVDVKSSNGYVAYLSNIAPHFSDSNNPLHQKFPHGYDLLQEVLKATKDKDIQVHASINTFSEGNNQYQEGPALSETEWQTVYYTAKRAVKASNGEKFIINDSPEKAKQNEILLLQANYYKHSKVENREVLVVNGKVTDIKPKGRESFTEISDGGSILSGSGEAAKWLKENVKIGDNLDFTATLPDFVNSANFDKNAIFVNPIRNDVQNYELRIIKEILDNYNVNGIVLDRARYSNIYADFSKISKESFEGYIGNKINNWPSDIFEISYNDGKQEIRRGPLYKTWLEWRAHNIQSFFKRVEALVKGKDETLSLSTYVGSWYPSYYGEGANWGSTSFKPEYNWTSQNYHSTGYAGLLDFLMVGNYYSTVSIEETTEAGNASWASVEGSIELAQKAVGSDTHLLGSLYLQDYAKNPAQFKRALHAIKGKTDGIMIFDLVYLEKYNWWDILEEEFK